LLRAGSGHRPALPVCPQFGYTGGMEKTLRAFKTHEEADRAYMQSLTPMQRWSIFLELAGRAYDDPPQRLQRVFNLVKWDER
jgi:hypothetical protein